MFKDVVLSLFGGLAISCSGVALAATQAFGYNPDRLPYCDIFWWLWRIVGTVVGIVA
jgi:hypothetical protein